MFETEPLPKDSALWTHPHVYSARTTPRSPHPGAVARYIAKKILAFERGEPLAMSSTGRRGY